MHCARASYKDHNSTRDVSHAYTYMMWLIFNTNRRKIAKRDVPTDVVVPRAGEWAAGNGIGVELGRQQEGEI